MTHQLPSSTDIRAQVKFALAEDVGTGDITAGLIPADTHIGGKIIARENAILCGREWADEVFRQVDETVQLDWTVSDGDSVIENQTLVTIQGNARAILTAERCALNFLQTLSSTATQTAQFVSLVKHTQTKILDTRKTLPGLRSAQKYAVRVGGGSNHRMGLFDAFLIKENHIAACGGISQAIDTARSHAPDKPVEIEVRNLEEFTQALAARPDTIMLDNFSLSDMRTAVAMNDSACVLEASGGIGSGTLVSIAETGVDCISIGALTKHCRAIDLSLLIE